MKYLAILKDSVREAIDGKIFYVTVILSVLVSLGVAGLSFRPVPMPEAVEEWVGMGNVLSGLPERF